MFVVYNRKKGQELEENVDFMWQNYSIVSSQ